MEVNVILAKMGGFGKLMTHAQYMERLFRLKNTMFVISAHVSVTDLIILLRSVVGGAQALDDLREALAFVV